MPGRFLVTRRKNYPHMAVEDTLIWEEWIKQFGDEWETVDYDIRIGTGRDPGPEFDQNMRDMAIYNSKLRIDAVIYRGNEACVVEVKPSISLQALGQIIAYDQLFREEHPEYNPVTTCIIGERVHPDIERLLTDRNIIITLIEFIPPKEGDFPADE